MLGKLGRMLVTTSRRVFASGGIGGHHHHGSHGGAKRTLALAVTKCWRCGHHRRHVNDLFCDACHCIQRPHETDNYFKIFNIQPQFNLDVPHLQRRFRAMQSLLHPDKFANKSEDEKAISAEFSSLVNHAFNTLANPMARALHMLRLHRESIVEGDKSTDNEFLMHIMELNEAVEAVRTDGELRALADRNRLVLEQIERDLSSKFDENDIFGAKELVVKMKYYHTLSMKIKEAMGDKGIVD